MKLVLPAAKKGPLMSITFDGACTLFQVFDMKTSVAFYRDVLGFSIKETSDPGEEFDWCWLEKDNTQLMLNTMYEKPYRPDAPDEKREWGHGDAELFFGCRDLDGAYEYLKSKGVDVEPPVTRPFGMRQLGFSDPDGYGICLTWPTQLPATT